MSVTDILIAFISVTAFLVFSGIEPGMAPLAKILLYVLGPLFLIRILSGLSSPLDGERPQRRSNDGYI